MENIINQVIESEYRAQKIIAEAQEESKLAESRIENEIRKIKEDVFLLAQKKVEDIRSEKQKYAKAQTDKIMSEAGVKASLMREKLVQNRDRWVKLLLDNVLDSNNM